MNAMFFWLLAVPVVTFLALYVSQKAFGAIGTPSIPDLSGCHDPSSYLVIGLAVAVFVIFVASAFCIAMRWGWRFLPLACSPAILLLARALRRGDVESFGFGVSILGWLMSSGAAGLLARKMNDCDSAAESSRVWGVRAESLAASVRPSFDSSRFRLGIQCWAVFRF